LPNYKFKNHQTGETWIESMGISDADKFLAECPHIERLVHGAPMIVTGIHQFGHKKKPDSGFRDVLKNIKKRNPRNTIDTY